MKKISLLVVLTLLLSSIPFTVLADDTVCCNITTSVEYTTIKDAVQEASSGDTIEVFGSYTENNTITIDKNITIKGRTGQEIVTRDTSQNQGSMFRINNVDTGSDSIVLTIKNIILDGGASWNDIDSISTRTDANSNAEYALIRAKGKFIVNIDEGTVIQNCNSGEISGSFLSDLFGAGAIACQSGKTSELNLNGAIIKNCSIKHKSIWRGAGAICCEDILSVNIKNSKILQCATLDSYQNSCGGGAVFYDCETHITDSEISGNYCYWGGGAFTQYNNVCTITDSIISNNVADTGGVAVIYGNGKLTLDGNTMISGNHAQQAAGAFFVTNSSMSTIDPSILHVLGNTKILENEANLGGGIYCSNCRVLDVGENAEIALNKAKKGGGIYSNAYVGMETFDIKGSIYQNKAETEGADIYAEGTSAEIIELPIASAMHKVFYDPNDSTSTPFDIDNWYYDYAGDRFNPYSLETDSYIYNGKVLAEKNYLSLVAASNIKYLVKVTYDKNAADAYGQQVDTNEHLWGDEITILNEGSMRRPSYSFEKWNTAADGSGIDYSP